MNKYTCAFCQAPCASLSRHWERCSAYKLFMRGRKRADKKQCVTPGCTNQRERHNARKCRPCRERELAYQIKQSGKNGWQSK